MSIKNKFVVKKEKNQEKSDNKAVKVNHNQLNAKRKMKKKNMNKISKEEKNVEENVTSQVIENSNIPGSSTLKAGTVQGSIIGQKRKLEQSNTEVLNRNKKKKNKFVAEINIEEENVGENVTSKSVETPNIPEPSLKNKKKKKNTQQTNATGNETSAKSSIDGDQETNVQQAPNNETSSQLPGSEITLELLLNDSAFSALDGRVCEETLKAVQEMGFSKMTEIQAKAIPPLLEGRDVVASAKTGSGKTLAFLIPAIELVHKLQFMPRHGVGCIIISPTRELSMQTFGVLKELMAHHHLTYGLIMGGASRSTEAHKLAKGINIVVATPGRLLDHLQNTPDFLYKNLQCLVIDEADRILQIGFEEDMKQIINLLPKKRQTMLFSATTTSKTEALTRLALKKEPAYVGVQDKAEAATVDGLEQGYVICPSERRFLLLFTFLKKNRKKKVMVFFSSCLSVQFHHELLNFIDLNCMCIHGKQKQMKRTTTFFEFCNASEGILLCTDVAARGLDIPDVDWIVQYDPPDDPKEYIHRVGRTARGANGRGHALLILRPEELGFLFYLKQARIPVNEYEVMDKKVADIQCQLELLISKNYFLNKSAKEAFKSYVRAYDSHHLKLIFDISKLDLVKVAKSFGFTVPPAVDLQVAKSKKSRPQKRTGGGGFGFYKNMNREKSHQNIKYLQPKR